MKLHILLLACMFLCLLSKTNAQQAEKFDPANDHREVRGYVIHLMPSPGGGFGFIVTKDKASLWAQTGNPFLPGSHKGFTYKADAYKLAEWIVSEREKNSTGRIVISPGVAMQLNISERAPKS